MIVNSEVSTGKHLSNTLGMLSMCTSSNVHYIEIGLTALVMA